MSLPDALQVVLETVPEVKIEQIDLTAKSPEEIEETVLSIRARMSHRVFNTDHFPWFEFIVLMLPNGMKFKYKGLKYERFRVYNLLTFKR